jgi:hypothetical protein
LCSGVGFSSALDKYLESEFDLSSGLGFSRPLDKYQESEIDLSSGLGFWKPLDKYPGSPGGLLCEPLGTTLTYQVTYHSVRHLISTRGAPVGYFARLWERVLLIN